MKSNWIVPFKGRNHSGYIDLNFLWQNGSIYIMDNHRAALWCWLQQVKLDEKYNIFHIDRHYDASDVDLDIRKASFLNNSNMDLEDYLGLKSGPNKEDKYTIVYDNYLSIFFEFYKNIIKLPYFLTHKEGCKPVISDIEEKDIWKVAENIDNWLSNHENKWILNLDLDYFFCDTEGSRVIMFSDEYIETMFEKLFLAYSEGRILVITIALSPDWTNSWEEAEKLCAKFCKIFQLNFTLPG